jgi:hypothetical protein
MQIEEKKILLRRRRKKCVDESGRTIASDNPMIQGKTIRRPKIDNYAPVRHRSSKIPFGKDKNDRLWRW